MPYTNSPWMEYHYGVLSWWFVWATMICSEINSVICSLFVLLRKLQIFRQAHIIKPWIAVVLPSLIAFAKFLISPVKLFKFKEFVKLSKLNTDQYLHLAFTLIIRSDKYWFIKVHLFIIYSLYSTTLNASTAKSLKQ